MPLRLIADVSDGLDDGLIGDVAFDGGGTGGEVDSHFIDALQALQGLFHIGTAVVAPFEAPSFRSDMAVGITPQEQRGSGTPRSAAQMTLLKLFLPR